jgi:hypothetical protein
MMPTFDEQHDHGLQPIHATDEALNFRFSTKLFQA